MRAGKELKTTRLALLLSVKTVAAPQYYAHVVTSPYPSLFVRPRRSSVAGMRLEDGGALKVDNEQTSVFVTLAALDRVLVAANRAGGFVGQGGQGIGIDAGAPIAEDGTRDDGDQASTVLLVGVVAARDNLGGRAGIGSATQSLVSASLDLIVGGRDGAGGDGHGDDDRADGGGLHFDWYRSLGEKSDGENER